MKYWRGWVPVLMILLAAQMAILPWTATKILGAVLFTALIVMAVGGVFFDWEKSGGEAEVEAAPKCRVCGYDLRASKERCPECGTAIGPGEALVYSPMLNRVLERAEWVAREMGVEYVGTEHVLEAML